MKSTTIISIIFILAVQLSFSIKLNIQTKHCYASTGYELVSYWKNQKSSCPLTSPNGRKYSLWSKDSVNLCCYYK